MRLKPRVVALENANPEWKPWHQVKVNVGQTEDEAIAAYEAQNGPIGDDNCMIIRFVAPDRKDPSPCA